MSRTIGIALCVFGLLCAATALARILNVPEDYRTIQAGIDSSSDGDTVLVAPGRYIERLSLSGPSIVLASWILMTGRSEYIDSTIINADRRGCVLRVEGGETQRSLVRGFTMWRGRQSYGGGIDCRPNTQPTFEDIVLVDNLALEWGGGFYAAWGETHPVITIRRCRFKRNIARVGGGAAALTGIAYEHCEFIGNDADYAGAVEDRTGGGGFSFVSFTGNGGNPCVESLSSSFNHLTFTRNGGRPSLNIKITGVGNTVEISNSVLWDVGESIRLFGGEYDNNCEIQYSNIKGGIDEISPDCVNVIWGDGNIDSDPLFLDPANGDYHLSANSPCIDAGDPAAPLDPDGTRADIGAFYFHQRDIEVTPLEIHFPAIPWDAHDSTMITVRNVGGTPLQITQIMTPNNMACIGVRPEIGQADPPIDVAPDSSLLLTVYFNPDLNGGPLQSSISIVSNDPDEPGIDIRVDGEALAVPSDNLQFPIFNLQLAYPNPFNGSTTIRFGLDKSSRTALKIYGLSGRLVDEVDLGRLEAGEHSVVWNAEGLPGGMYLVRLESGQEVRTTKAVLLR